MRRIERNGSSASIPPASAFLSLTSIVYTSPLAYIGSEGKRKAVCSLIPLFGWLYLCMLLCGVALCESFKPTTYNYMRKQP